MIRWKELVNFHLDLDFYFISQVQYEHFAYRLYLESKILQKLTLLLQFLFEICHLNTENFYL